MSTPSKRSLKPAIKHRSGFKPNIPEEIWNRYEINISGCWIYTKALDRYGYGQFRYYGYSGHRAHVVSWLLTYGDISDGLVIDHICANRSCINPEHLRLLTAKENVLDGVSRKSRRIQCKYGHKDYGDRSRKNVRCKECDRERHRSGSKPK